MVKISYSLGVHPEECNQAKTLSQGVVQQLQSRLDRSPLGADGDDLRKVESPDLWSRVLMSSSPSGFLRAPTDLPIPARSNKSNTSGFVIGMYGLDHPASHWAQTTLGLLVTGMVAQGYALYYSIKRMQQLNC
ncbi:MAG: hypothetical protein CV088_07130 [Nitrospira sp. LK70]|nr:hypothetical protein [Nitrospira sp. LK70]